MGKSIILIKICKIVVWNGEKVKTGELIAYSGYAGNVKPEGIKGAHLHFEYSDINPYEYYKNKVAFNINCSTQK